MRGHLALLAMRRSGKRPAFITFTDSSMPFRWDQRPESLPYPDVEIEADDSPELIDIRFVVGLPVVVSIGDEQRMRRVVLAAERAGASRVYGCAADAPAICTEGEDQSWRG